MRRRSSVGRGLFGLLAAGAMMLLCCGGVGLVASCLAVGVGLWVGGAGLVVAAVIGLGGVLVLRNRRRCRRAQPQSLHQPE